MSEARHGEGEAEWAETWDGERMTVTTRAALVEINVFDIDSDEALSTLRLDPYNAKRLAFLIDAEAWRTS